MQITLETMVTSFASDDSYVKTSNLWNTEKCSQMNNTMHGLHRNAMSGVDKDPYIVLYVLQMCQSQDERLSLRSVDCITLLSTEL